MGRVGKDAPEQESFPLPYRIDNSGKALIRIIRDFYNLRACRLFLGFVRNGVPLAVCKSNEIYPSATVFIG